MTFNYAKQRSLIAAPEASTASAAASTTTLGPRTSLVDLERTAHEILLVQVLDGRPRLVVIGHLHKSEASRPARVPIRNDSYGVDRAVSLEGFPDIVLARIEGHVPYVQLHFDLLMVPNDTNFQRSTGL